MGSRGLWRHVEGVSVAPKLHLVVDGIPVLEDKKTAATEEQLELKEAKMFEFEKREYLAQHIILLTMSVMLGAKIKDIDSVKDMWTKVKTNTTIKSTLYLIDVEDQLTSMKLQDNNNPKTHLSELKTHFQTMLQCCDNLVQMGLTLSDTRFKIVHMLSLLESYRPTLQTITAAERTSQLAGGKTLFMKHDDLIAFIIEEAQHQVINDECTKSTKMALARWQQ